MTDRRLAGVSAFGFSGTNAHVIVGEAPAPATGSRPQERPLHVATLSAAHESALPALAASHAAKLQGTGSIADVAFTMNAGRAHLAHRVAMSVASIDDLKQQLERVAAGESSPSAVRGYVTSSDRPRIAFLFTGQGSQYVGMGRQLYETQPVFREAMDRCDELLRAELERPLLSVIYEAESSTLTETRYAQPALFSIEYALAELWKSWGIVPSAVLGHSVGEFAAACSAGVLSLEDAVKLIAARGRLMQALPTGGAMAAVFAGPEAVSAALQPYRPVASVAALNGPTNTVISGKAEAIETLVTRFASQGIRAEPLAVSHAFHSPLMEPMLADFAALAAAIKFSTPKVAFVSTVTGAKVRDEITRPEYWRDHISRPVQFAAGVKALFDQGYRVFLEIGPRPILTGMSQQVVDGSAALWLPSLRNGQDNWQTMTRSVSELYARGADVSWEGFDRPYRRSRLALPTYTFRRERYRIAPPSNSGAGVDPSSFNRGAGQPFGGRRIPSPLKPIQFEFRVGRETPSFVADHRKHDHVVFPATGFIEMVAVASESLGDGWSVIEDFVIAEPLLLEDDGLLQVQVILTPEDGGSAAFEILSLERPSSARESDWRLHASGRVGRTKALTKSAVQVEQLRGACDEAMEVAGFYDDLDAAGHQYGDSFRTVVELRRRDGEAFARVQLPQPVAEDSEPYRMHPALFDGCLQVMGAAFPAAARKAGEVFIPLSFDRIVLAGAPGASVVTHATIRETSSTSNLIADVEVFDESGRFLAGVEGMQLRRLDRDAVDRAADREADASLYVPVWRAADLPAASPSAKQAWAVVADEGGFADALAAALEMQEQSVRLIRGDLKSGIQQALAAHAGDSLNLIYLRGLDGHRASSSDDVMAIEERLCGGLLDSVLALAGSPARLWVITRGAQACGETRSVNSVQAALWGLSATVEVEQRDLRCTRIDLDPGSDRADVDADLLVRELRAADRENRLVYRGGERHVQRLVRSLTAAPPEDRKEISRAPFELDIAERGLLDRLELRPMERRAPLADEVEIEVSAAGLNFRDVLNALGVYEGNPGPLGAECAGRVSAAGSAVRSLQVGQEVIALSTGTFKSHVCVPAAYVVPKPAALTTAEAAALLVPFTTARHALYELAGLRAGERVLIHAAAGGVGLAAVQLAQMAGAEVFATAGSPRKHEFLRSAGVKHIMSSRTTDFAAQVMAITGGLGVDVVLNSLNGEFIPKSLSVLGTGGRFLEIGKAGIWSAAEVADVRPDVSYFPIYLGELPAERIGALALSVVTDVSAGRLKPLPVESFPIDRAADAFRHMAQAKHIGKISLTFGSAAASGAPFRSDASYLITGGLGALGLEVAHRMVNRGARSLVLVSRRPPSTDAAETIESLQRSGASVHVKHVDVSKRDEVEALFEEIDRTLPPLKGIVHAAGVADDGVLADQTWERFAGVLAPKIAGAVNLDQQSRSRDLDFFVMFSSVTSVIPAAGQGSYAAANAFLDALAHERRALGLPGLSVNWGQWSAGMAEAVDDRTRRRWIELGMRPLDVKRGTALFERLLQGSVPQVVAFPVDWSKFLGRVAPEDVPPLFDEIRPGGEASSRRGASAEIFDLRAELARVPPNKQWSTIESYVRKHTLQVLGLDEASSPLDHRQPLTEFGLDSLMAVELRNAIGRLVGRTLPATLLFKYPTVETLTTYLATDVLGLANPAETGTPSAVPDADVVEVQELDDEEAKRMLASELAALTAEGWLNEK